ncbi:MAG: tRNA (N6-isopentenyl adenosine(37)-C2)-methylthiotransferase MiaB [Anaerolineaceae bacterium]
MKYHIWTEGCQMNVADSQRMAAALERLGLENSRLPDEADVIILNTCVVRQSAEDKAYGRLSSLRPLKTKNPELIINLMGCMVGLRNLAQLKERFPYVDVFSPPSDPGPLIAHLTRSETRRQHDIELVTRNALLDEELPLPKPDEGQVSVFLPVVLGCSHGCTYCVIPSRRGKERSRPPAEILAEASSLAHQGVKEITLLGQIVDRYGCDLKEGQGLSDLLCRLSEIEGIQRIRYLTSHPNYLTDRILETTAGISKVCPHIEVPVQAGDDNVLAVMRRGYTANDYRILISRIRTYLPEGSIGTDIIVGFPGETDDQFQNTVDLLEELKLDVAHLARYSPRPDTPAYRNLNDDVTANEKLRRFRVLEEQQERIVGDINSRLLGTQQEVLFETKVRGRWRGRTRTNKLVFVESEENLSGALRLVKVTWAGPWSMQATLA